MENESILHVENLRISFSSHDGRVKAVRGLSFDLKKGKTLALVGESGSGKSVTSRAIMGVLESNSEVEDGKIMYRGRDLLHIKESEYNHIRGSKISMIFQDTMSTLNPLMLVGKQIKETILKRNKREKKEKLSFLKEAKKYVSARFYKTISSLYEGENEIDPSLIEKEVQEELLSFQETYQRYKLLYIQAYQKVYNAFSSLLSSMKKEGPSFMKEYKKIRKEFVHLIFPFKVEKDFFLQDFFSSMDSEIKAYQKSFKIEEKRMKLFETYQEAHYDYYALPIEIQKKEREVIRLDQDIFSHMVKMIEEIIFKIQEKMNALKEEHEEKEYLYAIIEAFKFLKENKKNDVKEECLSMLKEVGLDAEKVYYQYPFELSGGMRQRIVIAIALASNPEILICDEPTTALDVSIQKQILNLIEKLKMQRNLSILFITHDLSVVSKMADEVAIMYGGKIVEYGNVYDIFYDPRHPYTWALLSSLPSMEQKDALVSIPGSVPDMRLPTKGDLFSERNAYALEQDRKEMPPFFEISPTHKAATWLLHPYAKEVEPPLLLKERIRRMLEKNPKNIPTYTLKKNSVLEWVQKEMSLYEER